MLRRSSALPDPHAAEHDHLADPMIAEEWAAGTIAATLRQVGAYTPPWLAI